MSKSSLGSCDSHNKGAHVSKEALVAETHSCKYEGIQAGTLTGRDYTDSVRVKEEVRESSNRLDGSLHENIYV